MSDTLSGNHHVLEFPQNTIGAQELLKVGSCAKYGVIRKEERLERIFTFLKWPQRFVVLSRGCMYLYKDEMSTSPAKAWSMKIYKKCERSQLSRIRWSFRVLPRNPEKYSAISFACATDEIRKEWMGAIREEMIKASMIAQPEAREPVDLDDYIYLEKEVTVAASSNPAPTEDDDDDEEYDPEVDYDTIKEDHVKPAAHKEPPKTQKKPSKPTFKVEAPVASTTTKTTVPHKKHKMPSPPPSPTSPVSPAKSDVSRVSFQYDSRDREEVGKMLTDRPEGTYLVRKSRNDQNEVLSVNLGGILKEYKIYIKGDKVTIDHTDYFDNVEDLVYNYCMSPLPKKTNKLLRAFSQTDPGYVNRQ